jgi:hypothetical protein
MDSRHAARRSGSGSFARVFPADRTQTAMRRRTRSRPLRTRLPSTMMLASVDGQDDNGLGSFAEVHGVREARQDRSSDVVVDFGKGKGIGRHAIDNLLKSLAERPPEAGPTILAPWRTPRPRLQAGRRLGVSRVSPAVCGERPSNRRTSRGLPRGRPSGDRARLAARQSARALRLAPHICQTVPKRHR